METLPTHYHKKNQLVKSKQVSDHLFPLKVHIAIHDVHLCFHVTSEEIIKELYDHYPLSWFTAPQTASMDVFWSNSRDLGWTDEDWENEPSPDCIILNEGERTTALQRDFAASKIGNQCFVVCPYALDDGFYNFLRWLLPHLFLEKGLMLLHSSCILDDNEQAYFSLGESGAGKSTIASYRARKKILGDDMNVIKIKDGQCWAQAGALGQAILNPAEYSNWYPVKTLFWLKKAEKLEITPMDKAAQLRCLSTSVANVFWDQLPAVQTQKIFHFTWDLLKYTAVYQLAFPKRERLWNDIFAEFDKQLVKDKK